MLSCLLCIQQPHRQGFRPWTKRQWVNSHPTEACWCFTGDLALQYQSILIEHKPHPHQHCQAAGNSPRMCQGCFCPSPKETFSLRLPKDITFSQDDRRCSPGAAASLRNTAAHTTPCNCRHTPVGHPNPLFSWWDEKRDLPPRSAKPHQDQFPTVYSHVSAGPHTSLQHYRALCFKNTLQIQVSKCCDWCCA